MSQNYTFETWAPSRPVPIDPIPVVTAAPVPLQGELEGSIPKLVFSAEDCKPGQEFDAVKVECQSELIAWLLCLNNACPQSTSLYRNLCTDVYCHFPKSEAYKKSYISCIVDFLARHDQAQVEILTSKF